MYIAIQKQLFKPFKSQYNTSIAIQFFHYTPLYCNKIFSSLHHHIAIQFSSQLHQSCNTIPILQYTFTSQQASQYLLCHNTISHRIVTQLGSSLTVSAALFKQNFFFHSFLLSYLKFTKKLYISIFFSFSNTPK